jgi:hypothetical protein
MSVELQATLALKKLVLNLPSKTIDYECSISVRDKGVSVRQSPLNGSIANGQDLTRLLSDTGSFADGTISRTNAGALASALGLK